MAIKSPYQGLHGDERRKVMDDGRDHDGPYSMRDFDEEMADRSRGVNADPTEGPRDGVRSVKRMHPDRYIPNGGCK